MPTYYPFFVTNPVGMESGTVGSSEGYISIGTGLKPGPNWPELTVKGKVGINYNPEQDYDAKAPELAVMGKVGINYDFTNANLSYAVDAPDLAIKGKVGIGYDINYDVTNAQLSYAVDAPDLAIKGKVGINYDISGPGSSYAAGAPELAVNGKAGINYDFAEANASYAVNAPELAVNGKVGINYDCKLPYAAGAPELAVNGKVGINYDFAEANASYAVDAPELAVKGKVGIGYDCKLPYDPYAPDLAVKGKVGIGYDFTTSSGNYDDTNAPALSVLGKVVIGPDLREQSDYYPSEVQHDPTLRVSGNVWIGHPWTPLLDRDYILMGHLKSLLKDSAPLLLDKFNNAYGMRVGWDTDFVMLKLVHVDKHCVTKTVGKKKKTTKIFPDRKDAVLAWGDKRENYFRIRYIGEEVDVLTMDAKKKPLEKTLTDPKKSKEKNKRQRAYNIARRRILAALADPAGQKIDVTSLQEEWPGYRDIVVVDPDGSVVVNGAIYALRLFRPSDSRLKEAVEPIRSAKDLALAMRGVRFAWKGGDDDKVTKDEARLEYGMIAQEVEKLCPAAVSTDADGLLAIDYDQIVPILLEAIKDQEKVIDSQHSRLDRLEKLVENLVDSPSKGRKKATAAPQGKSPAPKRSPAARSAPSRTDRAGRGPRQ